MNITKLIQLKQRMEHASRNGLALYASELFFKMLSEAKRLGNKSSRLGEARNATKDRIFMVMLPCHRSSELLVAWFTAWDANKSAANSMSKNAVYLNHFAEPLLMSDKCVAECSASGPVDEAVARWSKRVKRPEGYHREGLIFELQEYGAWSNEELQDDAANWQRIIWIAACNIKEGNN